MTTESTIEELQRENAELRERLDQLRKLLSNIARSRTLSDLISPEIKSRVINSMSSTEIGPHLRDLALRCVHLARESADAQVARELEDISIELAGRAGSLEAIFTVPGGPK
jgi:cell division septum initiation protein DivIVA